MIVSFYDKNFKGLQNNASLVVAKDSYSLVKRPIEMNTLKCKCEPFTEEIQPVFMVVSDNKGGYVYGCLAGIPLLNENNQTEINGTDLKSMLSSDVYLEPGTFTSINNYIAYVFNAWNFQVNQESFGVELRFNSKTVPTMDEDWFRNQYGVNWQSASLQPTLEKGIYNAYNEITKFLRFYNLFLETSIDLVNKKVIFDIGKLMYRNLNIKLWEYGIRNYGKWVADVNETQGYYESNGTFTPGTKWILTSLNQITTTPTNRDIYPVKKRIVKSSESLQDANEQALTTLLDSLYNEDINLNADDILQANANFETRFSIYTQRGKPKYKELPCGELHFDSNGVTKVQIGWRYSMIEVL